MKEKNYISIFLSFIIVAILYAIMNNKVALVSGFFIMLWIAVIFLLIGIPLYFLLSITKINHYVNLLLTGMLVPIINNGYVILKGNFTILDIYPYALIDSLILGFILVGVYFFIKKYIIK